jgi:hypothetical protein
VKASGYYVFGAKWCENHVDCEVALVGPADLAHLGALLSRVPERIRLEVAEFFVAVHVGCLPSKPSIYRETFVIWWKPVGIVGSVARDAVALMDDVL